MKRIIGLMSGTSVDGVDVAVIDVRGHGFATRFKLLAAASVPYHSSTRKLILSSLDARNISVAEISQLNVLIAELFADAVVKVCRRRRIPLSTVHFIGSHGQTVYHQAVPSPVEGRAISSTMQLGESAVLAERTGVTVISDFRARDVAAGGTGAPLVPYVDYLLLRDPRKNRIALNIGGIANVTCIPRKSSLAELQAFDTGPGNMMLDAAVFQLSGGRWRFDRDGAIAARGQVSLRILDRLLQHPFYRKKPPKAAGREQFGIQYTREVLSRMRPAGLESVMATLTELTAKSIVDAIRKFSPMRSDLDELIVSGGGARNCFMMSRLQSLLPNTKLMTSSDVGIDLDAKEAIAFALLANETWHRHPANVPSVTGARHPVILGKITPA